MSSLGGGAWFRGGAFYPYKINSSAHFYRSNSDYMNLTPSA